MAVRKHRRKDATKQALSDPCPRDMDEQDLWSQICARASEVATLAEVYPTLAADYVGRRAMGNIVAIIGEKCQQLVELIDATWKRRRPRS